MFNIEVQMITKKSTLQLSIGTIILIVLIISALIIVFALFNHLINEPKFTIYKPECHNLTICEGEFIKNVPLVRVNEVYKIFLVLNPDNPSESEYWYQKCDINFSCEKTEVDEIEGWFENSCSGLCDCYTSMSCELTDRFILIFQNETNKNLMLNWIENYTSKDVEYKDNKLYFEKGSYDDAIKLSMINDICNLNTISISEPKCKGKIDKSKITKEWLSEQIDNGNCECQLFCIGNSDDCVGRGESCVKYACKTTTCKKYKCFENYTVEIN